MLIFLHFALYIPSIYLGGVNMASKSIKKSKTTKHVKSFQSILTQHVPIKTILYLIIIVFVAVAFYAFQTNKNMSNTSKAAPMQTWVNPFQFRNSLTPTISGTQNQTTCRAQCMQEANSCKNECHQSRTECQKRVNEEINNMCADWEGTYPSKSACIKAYKYEYRNQCTSNPYSGRAMITSAAGCIDGCNKLQKDCNNRCK